MSAASRDNYDDWQRLLSEDEDYERWADGDCEDREPGIQNGSIEGAGIPRSIPAGEWMGAPF